jgi:hypothetical protein
MDISLRQAVIAATASLGLGALVYYLTRPVGTIASSTSSAPPKKPAPKRQPREPTLARSTSANEERKAPVHRQVDRDMLDSEEKTLTKEALLKVFMAIITIHKKRVVSSRQTDIRHTFIQARRPYFKTDKAKYQAEVAEFLRQMSSGQAQDFKQGCELFGIEQEVFMKAMTKYAADPDIKTEFLKLHNGDDETSASWPADLTPEKLIEVLRREIEVTKTKAAEAEVLSEEAYTTAMAEIEDEIYELFTLEYDEKLAAYNHYQANPELKQAMRELKAAQQSLLKKKVG